ncbi:GIP, partial [Symbiodinium necroappetens]
DFEGGDRERLDRAILKEINNNLETGAYKILSLKESQEILHNKPEKVMESRYVLTKKPLEPADISKARAEGLLLDDKQHGPVKAKCRHVMKGFSEEAALDVESTTPQVNRDSVIFVTQVLASMQWCPGFLDFTQAFHSGDKINRELYCRQPAEGIPGMHRDQILMLLKTCYGLTDGPYAWYQHLCRRLREMGYQTSKSDPCVFFLHEKEDSGRRNLEGIIGLATDDMLHGGTQKHWDNIQKIAEEYKLGKNQKGKGRFTGKDIALQPDGSILIDQEFYVKEKVADLIECNKIIEEAIQHSKLGIRVMPIDWRNLRVSVVTDAAWGNSRDQLWIENSEEDFWEETSTEWVRHHKTPRRTSFHPGAAQGGPDLHQISSRRRTEMFVDHAQAGIKTKVSEDTWNDDKGIRVLDEEPWRGTTRFRKCSSEEPALATLAAWKSFRLKRKTVDTL